MKLRNRWQIGVGLFLLLALMLVFGLPVHAHKKAKSPKLTWGLEEPYLKYYRGNGDGGLAHRTYWTMATDSEDYLNLPPEEQAKVGKIQANVIHSELFDPTEYPEFAGYEATGLLKRGDRAQRVTLRLPRKWNGYLIVCGTPGLRNEYANEAIFVPWLLEAGYALISGDKGLLNGSADMLSGNHPTQHWGETMIDLVIWAKESLTKATKKDIKGVYAVGLSNGGYQVRRALEIDHAKGTQLFDGGLDWAGSYYPDKRVLDTNGDGKVSLKEYSEANTQVSTTDVGALTMRWYYDSDTLTKQEEFEKRPPYPGARPAMLDAGFSSEADVYYGYYNKNFDSFKVVPGFEIFQGVGYYNLVSYLYRADLLGDDAAASAAYSCYYFGARPALYDWLENAVYGGWTDTAVYYALKNANSGEFSVPMISIQGQADGLVGLYYAGYGYRSAVEKYGNPEYHRFYVLENAGHVDTHADGHSDFNVNGVADDEFMKDELTPMQAYVERAFQYLIDWVENGKAPPGSKLIVTDSVNDAVDPAEISFE